MTAAGHRLGLRLFLEGLEVPVIGAQVQVNINLPATASIQIVPGDKVLELKPRTMVHLFFWDYTQDLEEPPLPPDPERVASENGISIDKAKELIAENPDDFATPIQNEMRGYKLLFTGEVIGVVMLRSPLGRQAVLQCSDFSTYWDTTYQFFVSYSPGGNFLGTSAAVWAGSDAMFDDLTGGHVSVMNEYLQSTPQTPGLQKVEGLMGGIISLLEAMGGVPKHTHGVNDFFTIAELKNHILQQIVAEENDDTALRLFDNKAFMAWLTRGMSSLGQLVTFRDMMKLLFQYIYYEVVPNPAAMYVPANKAVIKKQTKRVSYTADAELPAGLGYQIQVTYLTAQDYRRTNWTNVRFDEAANAKSFRQQIKFLINSVVMPKKYKSKLELTYSWLDKIKLVELVPGATEPPKQFVDNRNYWKKIEDIFLSIVKVSKTKNVTSTSRKPAELDRLHSQLFRPDCFFVAPPRCNVIFPDQYTQFQFSRNFLQETTRLRLSVDWMLGGTGGGLLAEYHFAPNTKDIREIAKLQGNRGIRALLPWEIYSGILPKFESIHEMNYVAGRNEKKLGLQKNVKGAATDYAQRTANFNYLKYRFAARTCEVSMRFNPFLVAGFPAAIIEKPFTLKDNTTAEAIRELVLSKNPDLLNDDISEFVKAAAKELGAPSQYLGMIAAMSHSVGQDGGSTSIVLTHARTHRITEDDFLDIFSKQFNRELNTEIVSTVLDARTLIKKGDWKNLKLMINCTPQNMNQQSQDIVDARTDIGDDENSPELEGREEGFPTPSGPAAQVFGSLFNPIEKERVARVVAPVQTVTSKVRAVPIRGKVKKERLKGGRKVILVPENLNKVVLGSTKGPNKGTIVQVQCFSNAAIGVLGSDINKRAGAGEPIIIAPRIIDEFVRDENGKLRLRPNVVDTKDVVYIWEQLVIHEEVETPKKIAKVIPVEEGLRPPWFSPLYSNWFIGEGIYEPFFGCGSIVDEALFISPNGATGFGTGRTKQQEMLEKLREADNDRTKIMKILEDAKAERISDVPDIESSVDVLAYVYGEIRRLGLDVHRFINDYTRRPIATMEDILGSDDLEYKIDTLTDTLELVKGDPGFHSTAIANVDGRLRGLIDNPDLELSRLKKGAGTKVPLSRTLDPRPGRRAKVVEYIKEIGAGSGSLGIGVQG